MLGEEDLSHAAARQALDKQIPPEHLREVGIYATQGAGLRGGSGRLLQRSTILTRNATGTTMLPS
jgi:hypothetical protein